MTCLPAAFTDIDTVDTITDSTGDRVTVAVLNGAVLIIPEGSPVILGTPETRDDFAKAYAEACRRAEAAEAEAAS
jgi:hypothetical protein